MNTSGQCIELFYWIIQRNADDIGNTTVSIVTIDEELHETIVIQSVGWNYNDFRRMFARLPDGIHQVAIDGIRDSRRIDSGLSVDDITVMECKNFGELCS